MLFRSDGQDVIAIAQPSHAWLSGQLVRAWGNADFVAPSPREEVCLGAEQHDIGWLPWEAAPTLNPQTGRPHDFREVATATHTALWTQGMHLALGFGRYPALLVSLHAKTIYEAYFDLAKASSEDAALVRAFLGRQHAFQQDSIAALAADPRYAADTTAEAIERNRYLVALSDRMSLAICWGVREEARMPDAPRSGTERVALTLRSPRGDPAELTLDPWPFARDRVEVICEGRRLRGRFSDEAAMRRALEDPAARVTLATVLRPA